MLKTENSLLNIVSTVNVGYARNVGLPRNDVYRYLKWEALILLYQLRFLAKAVIEKTYLGSLSFFFSAVQLEFCLLV